MDREIFRLQASVERTHWWFVGRRQIMRALVESLVSPSKDRLVVDVGCGTGGNIASLAGTYRAVGIDPAADAIGIARAAEPGVEFVCGPIPACAPEIVRKADICLLMDVLEHVAEDHLLLSNLVEATASGTYLLLTVPANPALWTEHDRSLGHYRRYTPESLSALWSELPIQVHLFSYFNSRLYPIIRIIRTVNRLRGSASGKGGTDLWELPQVLNRLLTRTFAGERHRLLRLLRGDASPYGRGASLIAILETG